jgi:hypothetical protein
VQQLPTLREKQQTAMLGQPRMLRMCQALQRLHLLLLLLLWHI